MNKNRKSQSTAIRLGPAIKALFLCLFFGGAAVGYVWQQRKLHELDVLQRNLEARLDSLRRDNRILANQLADLQLPYRLQERVRQLHVNLVPASPAQMVRLTETPLSVDPWASDPVLAHRSDTTGNPSSTD